MTVRGQSPGSAEQAVDVVGADPDLLVVVLAQLDVVEHIEVALRLAVLVQPDQRPGDVEGHAHRLRGLVRHERVRLAGRLIDPVAGGRHPVVLQVAPLAGDRVREDLLGVVVAVHHARPAAHEDVAPPVLPRGDPQRPGAHRVRQRGVVALVVGRRLGDVGLRQRAGLERMLDRLQVTPELTTACLGHVSSRTWDFRATPPVGARLPSDNRAGKRASPQMSPPMVVPRRQWIGAATRQPPPTAQRPAADQPPIADRRPPTGQPAPAHRPPTAERLATTDRPATTDRGDAMSADPPASLLRQFAAVVGAAHVLTGDAAAGYAVDWTGGFAGSTPAVLRPGDTEQVAALLALCADAGVPVVPQGGNTGLAGGSVPLPGEVSLSLTRLDRLGPVDLDAGQVSAGAGVSLQQVADADPGLDLGVFIASRHSATVGGAVATNAGGLRVLRYGPMRAQLRGTEAVLSDGTVLSHMSGLVKD